jgi:hypothetical protein
VGVTILAILEILFGLLMLLASLGFFVVAGLFASQDILNQTGMQVPEWLINVAPLVFAIAGIVFLIMALIAFLLAYGFLKGRGWAWTLAMIFSVISIILSVVGWVLQGFNPAGFVSMLISVIIPVIVILYLTRVNVKAWFGKA